MQSVRLFRSDNVIQRIRHLWTPNRCEKFTVASKKQPKEEETDPYEGNYNFTDCDQWAKVTVVGAAGRVGKTLSLLLKTCPLIDHLCLFDTDRSVQGIAADIKHIDTKCCVSHVCGMRNIQHALQKPDVVVIAAGCPTSPTLTGKKLFEKNAPIVAGLSEACARFCPKACVVLITSPINSLLPVMGEVYQIITSRIPERKLFGLTTLDVVRANTFVAEVVRKDPNNIIVPVIGGSSQDTIVPVFSQMKPCCKIKKGEMAALTECLKRAEEIIADCQNCGTPGASSLSTAYAGFRFTSSLVMALKGAEDVVECAYVKSNVIPELEYLASPVKLGTSGIEFNYGYPPLSGNENTLGKEKNKEKWKQSYLYELPNGRNIVPLSSGTRVVNLTPKMASSQCLRMLHTNYESRDDKVPKSSTQRDYEAFLEQVRSHTERLLNQSQRSRVRSTFKEEEKTEENKSSSSSSSSSSSERNTNFRTLNKSARQKYRSFNAQKKFIPSATVMILLEKLKKEKDRKNLGLGLSENKLKIVLREIGCRSMGGKRIYGKEIEEEILKKREEDDENEDDDDDEECVEDRSRNPTSALVVREDPTKEMYSSTSNLVLDRLQKFHRENEKIRENIFNAMNVKPNETALQVQSGNEDKRKKSRWSLMSSTFEAITNFCEKLSLKKNAKLMEAVNSEEDDEDEEEDCESDEESCSDMCSEGPKQLQHPDENYFRFLKNLMDDQSCSKS